MIRVLHLRYTDRICGPGKTILESCDRIDKNEFALSIGLLSSAPAAENAFWQAAEERQIPISSVNGRSRFGLGQVLSIARLVKEQQIDIIHSHDYKTDILGFVASMIAGVKIMTTAHGWITNSTRSQLYIRLGKSVLRWFDHVIAVSPLIEQELLNRGVARRRLSLVHNAIVVENYEPGSVEPGYLRDRFSIPAGAKIVGNIGRISPEKGQRDFVAAAREIIVSHDHVYFVLIGDGPDMQPLQRQVNDEGLAKKIFFAGHLRDVRRVYRDLDVMALTSYTEGFPNVVLESLCMGVPVLATNVGGVADIVTDGDTGVLVTAGDVGAIVAGLVRLIESSEAGDAMVANGRRKIAEQFTFSDRIARVEKIYKKVLAGTA